MKRFVFILLLSTVCFSRLPAQDAQLNEMSFQLIKSIADNLLDSGKTSEAVIKYKEALSLNKNCASCYMELGFIHLQKGLYEIALDYFLKAEKNKDNFYIEEEQINLYFYMSVTLHKMKFYEREITCLKKIIAIAEKYEEAFYTEAQGKASFITGLILYNKSESHRAEAVEYFYKAIDSGYRRKICFFYLLRYFHEMGHERNFRYYYQMFNETETQDAEKSFFADESKKMYIKKFDEYYSQTGENKR